MDICSFSDCGRPIRIKYLGLCDTHSIQWRKLGVLTPIKRLGRPVHEQFWEHVNRIDDVDSCWEWTASTDRKGYGCYRYGGTTRRAHRWAYLLTNGSIPKGKELHHVCENPTCVRPSHLVPLTRLEHAKQRAKPTHCKLGHPLTDEMRVYRHPNGSLVCRICAYASIDRYNNRQKLKTQ